jgi:HK97 family phage portal protein
MGLVDRINEQLHAPADEQRAWPVGEAVVDHGDRFWGHDSDQFSPEEYGDYLVTSNEIYSAVSLRARLVSSVPLKTYKGHTEDKVELPHSAPAKLLQWVNPWWSWQRLARMDELAMGVWGASYWAIEKKARGEPEEIWWLKPSRVTPVPHPSGYLEGFWYEPATAGPRIWFDADEIIWQRYPNPLDEFSPLSPVAAARLAADTASAMMKSNHSLHTNGLQIAGVLAPKGDTTYSPEQARKLEQDLQRRFSGSGKAHRWAVLRYEAEFKPVNISPRDAEFLGGLGATARMVYNAYGVSSALLNDLQHATLANLRELQTGLWEHALVPDLQLRAADIREQLLPMFPPPRSVRQVQPDHVEFDFDQVPALQKSKSEGWERDRQAIEVGAMTINEHRKRRGLPPVPWGDVWWAPVNKTAVTDAKSQPQGDTSPTTLPDKDKAPEKPAPKKAAAVDPDRARALLRAFDPPESETS